MIAHFLLWAKEFLANFLGASFCRFLVDSQTGLRAGSNDEVLRVKLWHGQGLGAGKTWVWTRLGRKQSLGADKSWASERLARFATPPLALPLALFAACEVENGRGRPLWHGELRLFGSRESVTWPFAVCLRPDCR